MSRSCARRRRPSTAFNGPKWMCWRSALFTPASLGTKPKAETALMSEPPVAVAAPSALKLRKIAAWRGIRVLAWHGDVLYGCRGYQIIGLHVGNGNDNDKKWSDVACFHPAWWRNLTARTTLTYRLLRDGFHALAVLDDQTMVGAVPG